MKKINVAILGFGLSGKVFHFPLLENHPLFEVKAILSSQDIPKAVNSIDQVLQSSEIELVINTLPNEFHYSISKKCLEAGKHLVVEKPFVTQIEEGEELIKLAKEKSLKISVFHNRRWDGDFLTLKNLLEEDKLGEINLYESRFDRFRPDVSDNWREEDKKGGGILFDLGPHLIDQALSIFGLPNKIMGDIRKNRKNAKVDDDFHITLFYSDKRVHLSASTLIAHQTPRLQVFGNKASYKSTALDPQESLLKKGHTPYDSSWPKENTSKGSISGASIENQPGNYKKFYDLLYQSIKEDQDPPVSPIDALNGLKVLELAVESSKTQKIVAF